MEWPSLGHGEGVPSPIYPQGEFLAGTHGRGATCAHAHLTGCMVALSQRRPEPYNSLPCRNSAWYTAVMLWRMASARLGMLAELC